VAKVLVLISRPGDQGLGLRLESFSKVLITSLDIIEEEPARSRPRIATPSSGYIKHQTLNLNKSKIHVFKQKIFDMALKTTQGFFSPNPRPSLRLRFEATF